MKLGFDLIEFFQAQRRLSNGLDRDGILPCKKKPRSFRSIGATKHLFETRGNNSAEKPIIKAGFHHKVQ
jgi:hypothetical protein